MPATYTNKSIITGKIHVLQFDSLTQEQFDAQFNLWRTGLLIQNAFPTLNADEREFIMTGITPEEWNEHIGEEE